MFSLGMCIAHNQMTAFDAAVEWAGRARAALGRTSPYLAHVEVRTRMRGLALSMVLEHRAGAAGPAKAHLADYLRLFAEADYAWPLARERTVALALLDDVADAPRTDAAVAATAAGLRETLRDAAGAREDPPDRPLSDREFAVLARLERQHDKEIAQA